MAQNPSRLLITLLFVAPLVACGPDGPPPDIIQPQREALDRAKGVEQLILDSDDSRRKKLDDAEK